MSETKRKNCKECPWINKNSHSQSWPDYVSKMESIGQIKSKRHACHMITSDTWGYNEPITEKNVCIGKKIKTN